MGIVLSESNVRQDTDAVFRQLFSQYGEAVFKTLLERCGDEVLARSMLKDIFKRVYESLSDKQHVDVTSLWLKSLVESELISRRLLPPPGAHGAHAPFTQGQTAAPLTPPPPPGPQDDLHKAPAEYKRPAKAKKGILARLSVKDKKTAAAKADKKGVTPARIAGIAALGAFILFLLWCILGLLMDIQAIPKINFGYDWFNSHVFELF